jgi:hypothetical protein
MAKVKLGNKEFDVDCEAIDASGCGVSAAGCVALAARMKTGGMSRLKKLYLVRFTSCSVCADCVVLCCVVETRAVQGDNHIGDEGAKAIAEAL